MASLVLTLGEGSLTESKPQVIVQNPLRLSNFSADSKIRGGEVGYEAWRYEVECLAQDDSCIPEALGRLVREVLEGGGRTNSVAYGT